MRTGQPHIIERRYTMNTLKVLTLAAGFLFSTVSHCLTVSSLYGDVDGINSNATSFFASRLIAPQLDSTFYHGTINPTSNFVGSTNNLDPSDRLLVGTHSFSQSVTLDPAAVIESAFIEIAASGHALIGLMSSVFIDNTFIGHYTTGTENTMNYLHQSPDSVNYSNLIQIRDLSLLSDGNINVQLYPGRTNTTWTLDYARLIVNYSIPEDKIDDSTDGSGGGTGGGTVAPVPVPAAFWLFASGIVFLMRKRAVNK